MIEGAAAELTVGDPSLVETDIGPVIDADQLKMLNDHVPAMRKTRGVVCRQGPERRPVLAPHIVDLSKAEALEREIFGPVLHVARWKAGQLDKVLDQIDATGFGLTLGVHSRIEETVRQVVERLNAGNIYVNRNMIGAVVGTQPFGGSGVQAPASKRAGRIICCGFRWSRW